MTTHPKDTASKLADYDFSESLHPTVEQYEMLANKFMATPEAKRAVAEYLAELKGKSDE